MDTIGHISGTSHRALRCPKLRCPKLRCPRRRLLVGRLGLPGFVVAVVALLAVMSPNLALAALEPSCKAQVLALQKGGPQVDGDALERAHKTCETFAEDICDYKSDVVKTTSGSTEPKITSEEVNACEWLKIERWTDWEKTETTKYFCDWYQDSGLYLDASRKSRLVRLDEPASTVLELRKKMLTIFDEWSEWEELITKTKQEITTAMKRPNCPPPEQPLTYPGGSNQRVATTNGSGGTNAGSQSTDTGGASSRASGINKDPDLSSIAVPQLPPVEGNFTPKNPVGAVKPIDLRSLTADRTLILVDGRRPRSDGPLIRIGGGIGGNYPINEPDLDPFDQFIDGTAGFAGRLYGELLWPWHLHGIAHFVAGIGVVYNNTVNDKLDNKFFPGFLDTSGRSSYWGAVPYLGLEIPVPGHTGLNFRVLGGLGVGERYFRLKDGGVTVARADGTVAIGQLGVGLLKRLSECVNIGLDLFWTYAGSIDGTAGVTPFKLESSRDVSAMITLGFGLDDLISDPRKIAGARTLGCGSYNLDKFESFRTLAPGGE